MRERERLKSLKQRPVHILQEKESDDGPKKNKKHKEQLRFKERTPFGRKLLQAGIKLEPRRYVLLAFIAALVAAYVAARLGPVLALFLFVALGHYLIFSFPEERAQRRKKKMLPHLPPFIDGLAAALGAGFNIDAALVQAAQGVPQGVLRSELDRVCAAINSGFPLRDSLSILRDRIAGREITSLVVAVNLFSSVGGTVLEPFRRLAGKLREQQAVTERASRDLVMVKQAFYLTFFLALSVPCLLMLVQPSYLLTVFNDPLGRVILQIGQIMVLMSLMIFKRMTRLRI